MLLVKSGLDYDVAESLGSAERMAWSVVLGEFEGGEFDWSSMVWRRR